MATPERVEQGKATPECATPSVRGSSAFPSELNVGSLFRDTPSDLLETLDENLAVVLSPAETEIQEDVVPIYPETISLKDVSDFHGMMECPIFTTYINTFLNLPLFSRSVCWNRISTIIPII